jgi:hypothetical protein
VSRVAIEVADIFRDRGPAWRSTHAGHISLSQLKAMSAIEQCRSAHLGGHVLHCKHCESTEIAYNSCRNRHCPKCQASAAKRWLEDRQAELLPVEYYHVVFTLPDALSALAYQNKSTIYGLLFSTAAESLQTIAADPKRLGAKIGVTMVLHTWGSALMHHPHVHCIVPGGGISADGQRWVPCRSGFFLPVRVLGARFRGRFLAGLLKLHQQGELRCFGQCASLADPTTFKTFLKPLHQVSWYVYAKRPFAGPEKVLEYLSRYTHRVAISNSRLLSFDGQRVCFRYKDYRSQEHQRQKVMTLEADEFIRRFLLHVLPTGFHRIRHYGFFANNHRKQKLAEVRALLDLIPEEDAPDETAAEQPASAFICRVCLAPMVIINVLAPDHAPRGPPQLSRAS